MIYKVKLFLTIIFFSYSSLSSDVKEYIVGVEDYSRYPFQYIINGEYKGRFRDLLDKFAKDNNIIFKYKPLKIDNLYTELYEGSIDFKFPDNPVWRSPEKKQYEINYSDIFTNYIDGIFVREDFINKRFAELKKFGVVDDVVLWSLSNREKKGDAEIIKANSCAELIIKLKNKDIDGIFCNYDVMTFLLKNSSMSYKVKINTNLPLIDNYIHISTIKYPEIIKNFNIWVSKNREIIEKTAHEN